MTLTLWEVILPDPSLKFAATVLTRIASTLVNYRFGGFSLLNIAGGKYGIMNLVENSWVARGR